MQLLTEARSEYSGPVGVQYFDTTFSVDKTISLAHASALASALAAQKAGDSKLAAQWEARAAGIWAEIEKSVRLYVAHIQREARFVRTGHHGRRIDGVETGRFEDAGEIPVAIFPQHTSRNGDPQLHVHVLWLNRVKTIRDGQWRAIDSRALYREKGAGSALAAFALESGLTRRFGFAWSYRPASKGRVIAGFPEKVSSQFSSHRTQITKTTLALAEEYERERGHGPDQRALASMRQFANAQTPRAKEPGVLDFRRLLREWEQTSRRAELGTLRDLANKIWPRSAYTNTTRMAAHLASCGELTHAQERAAMAAGLAQAQESKAAWHRADLIHCIAQNLPDHATARDQEQAWQLLEDLTDRALAGEAGEHVLLLDAPEWPRVPDSLRRANGESIYRPHGIERYATQSQLSLEDQMIAEAQEEAAPHLPRDLAAKLLGATMTQFEAQLHAHATAPDGATGTGLRLDQATAAFLSLTSPRRVDLIVGPAGTGKTYAAVWIAAAWREAGMGRVFGISATPGPGVAWHRRRRAAGGRRHRLVGGPSRSGSDHPVTHWLLAGEHRRKHPVRNLALTWPAITGRLRARFGSVPGHEALATDIRFFSDSEEELGRCPVVELLTAQVTMAGRTYVLVDGEVCRVDADFLAELDRELRSRVVPSVLAPYRPGEREDAYNARAAAAAGMLLLDKTDIRPSGATQIEPCDLLAPDGSLYHVKRHSNAAGISHVVSQAVASATVLLRRTESQTRLAELIDARTWGQAAKNDAKAALRRMPGSASRVPVTIVIIGDWTSPTIKSLSLLCRLALRTAVQRLGDLGYPMHIMLVARTT